MKPTEYEAIISLVGGGVSSGLTDDGKYEYTYHDGQTTPSQAEINAELKKLQDEYDNDYSRKREAEYPSIAELTVALYDDEDKAAIETKRAAVKAKYPKPS